MNNENQMPNKNKSDGRGWTGAFAYQVSAKTPEVAHSFCHGSKRIEEDVEIVTEQ